MSREKQYPDDFSDIASKSIEDGGVGQRGLPAIKEALNIQETIYSQGRRDFVVGGSATGAVVTLLGVKTLLQDTRACGAEISNFPETDSTATPTAVKVTEVNSASESVKSESTPIPTQPPLPEVPEATATLTHEQLAALNSDALTRLDDATDEQLLNYPQLVTVGESFKHNLEEEGFDSLNIQFITGFDNNQVPRSDLIAYHILNDHMYATVPVIEGEEVTGLRWLDITDLQGTGILGGQIQFYKDFAYKPTETDSRDRWVLGFEENGEIASLGALTTFELDQLEGANELDNKTANLIVLREDEISFGDGSITTFDVLNISPKPQGTENLVPVIDALSGQVSLMQKAPGREVTDPNQTLYIYDRQTGQWIAETAPPEDSISSQEMLSECVETITINAPLKGPAFVEGKIVNLNFAIAPNITFGLHPSGMRETAMADDRNFLPLLDMELNLDIGLGDSTREDSMRQIATDVMYMHYRAWQHSENSTYYPERAGITFVDYLAKLTSGEIEGGHQLKVVTAENQFKESVEINPLDQLIIIFGDIRSDTELNRQPIGTNGTLGNFIYDRGNNTLVVVSTMRPNTHYLQAVQSDPKYTHEVGWFNRMPYGTVLGMMNLWLYPDRLQITGEPGTGGDDATRMQELNQMGSEIITQAPEGSYHRSPLLVEVGVE